MWKRFKLWCHVFVNLAEYKKRVEAAEEKNRALYAIIERHKCEFRTLVEVVREHTELNMDVSWNDRDRTTVILIGRWKGKDSVQIYDLPGGDMAALRDMYQYRGRFAHGNKVDAAPGLKAVITSDWGI